MIKYLLAFALIFAFPTSINASSDDKESDIYCLSEAIYYEARNQTFKGQIAVANVIINRKNSKLFPDSICKVTYQKYNEVCQFSYYCTKLPPKPKNEEKFEEIQALVNYILKYGFVDLTNGATHYHANYVSPSWSKVYVLTYVEQDHLFYKRDN